MNNEITNFVFDEGASPLALRMVPINDEPWFVASDVASILGYRNAPDMVRNLDEDEADTHIVRIRSDTGTAQDREVSIINESGLDSAILRSRRPEAKSFKKWVTGQVLPSIRKTGAYAMPGRAGAQPFKPQQVQFLSHSADVLVAADRTFRSAMRSARSAGLPLHSALARANAVCLERTGIDMVAELDAAEQLVPAAPATRAGDAPKNMQAHMVEFVTAFHDGQIPGAALPMLSTQLYRFYGWWCRSRKQDPLSQMRFASLMVNAGAYRAVRKRYMNAAGETVGPMAFAMARHQPPVARFEPEWLGEAVGAANQALELLGA